ncbi:MAG: hypothetical protein ABW185_29235, partial [Sedimenticola sp.]
MALLVRQATPVVMAGTSGPMRLPIIMDLTTLNEDAGSVTSDTSDSTITSGTSGTDSDYQEMENGTAEDPIFIN